MKNNSPVPWWGVWTELGGLLTGVGSLYQGMWLGNWEAAGMLLVCALCFLAAAIRSNTERH